MELRRQRSGCCSDSGSGCGQVTWKTTANVTDLSTDFLYIATLIIHIYSVPNDDVQSYSQLNIYLYTVGV